VTSFTNIDIIKLDDSWPYRKRKQASMTSTGTGSFVQFITDTSLSHKPVQVKPASTVEHIVSLQQSVQNYKQHSKQRKMVENQQEQQEQQQMILQQEQKERVSIATKYQIPSSVSSAPAHQVPRTLSPSSLLPSFSQFLASVNCQPQMTIPTPNNMLFASSNQSCESVMSTPPDSPQNFYGNMIGSPDLFSQSLGSMIASVSGVSSPFNNCNVDQYFNGTSPKRHRNK